MIEQMCSDAHSITLMFESPLRAVSLIYVGGRVFNLILDDSFTIPN